MKNRDKLIEDNLGLVHSCCKRFRGKGIEYEDLYMSGCLGLVKAVDNFDPDRGCRLSTYAVPMILGEIKRMFRESGTVKVSRSLRELYLKITKLTEQNSDITVASLAEELNVTEEKITEAINASKLPISLTADDSPQCEPSVASYEEEYTEKLSLRTALGELEPQDRQLIELRYFHRKTQSQTGKILNLTQVQVCRREKRILLSIREKLI